MRRSGLNAALGCGFERERWLRKISQGKPATVYAHVVSQPDKPEPEPEPTS